MPKTFEGQLTGEGRRIGIVVSRFNHFITERLLEGAIDAFVRHGVRSEDVTVYRVPGSFEIPLVAKKVAEAHKVDGVLAIGALIRGSTPHFDFIAAEVTKGVAAIALEMGLPMTFGVLTTDTIEQAIERAGTKAGNKGWESAMALLEIINLYETID
jgi:6,7-dimethyl-8-ribityllumazine synthase